MSITRSTRRRRFGATTVLIGAALVMLGLMATPAQAGSGVFGPGFDVYLNVDHQGSTAAEAEKEGATCPENALVDGMSAWHFVLPSNEHDFETLDLAFQLDADPDPEILAGLTPKSDFAGFDVTKNFLASPTGKHAYVYTSGAASVTLLDGAAHVTPSAQLDKFNLSHACAGSESGDDGGDVGADDTVQATSGSADTPSESSDTEVEGEVIVPQELPATGAEDRSLLVLGIGCIAIGAVVLVAKRAVFIR